MQSLKTVKFCLFTAVVLLLATSRVQAQIADRPKAGPEQKKLEVFVGDWTYSGVLHDNPFGPGGKFKGKESGKLVLDGLFVQFSGEDTGNYGGKEITYKYVGMRWFDAGKGKFLTQLFDNDGFTSTLSATTAGETWTTSGVMTDSKGKTYQTRMTSTISEHGSKIQNKSELSLDDGKTWKPYWESTNQKSSPN